MTESKTDDFERIYHDRIDDIGDVKYEIQYLCEKYGWIVDYYDSFTGKEFADIIKRTCSIENIDNYINYRLSQDYITNICICFGKVKKVSYRKGGKHSGIDRDYAKSLSDDELSFLYDTLTRKLNGLKVNNRCSDYNMILTLEKITGILYDEKEQRIFNKGRIIELSY